MLKIMGAGLQTPNRIGFCAKSMVLFGTLVTIAGVGVSSCEWAKSGDQKVVGIAPWVSNHEYDRNIEAFKDALAARGYSADRVRFVEATAALGAARQRAIIQGFLDKPVDLIYSLTTPGTLIAKKLAPANLPIVFSIVTYPVQAGVIKSLKSSGNNLVGSRNWVDIGAQLGRFLDIAPDSRRIGYVHRHGEPNSTIQYQELTEAAAEYGITVVEIAPRTLAELPRLLEDQAMAPAFAGREKKGIDSLYSACDTLVQGGGEELVIAFAAKHALPDFTCNKSGVLKGSLVGLVTDFAQLGAISGELAGHILDGTPPTELSTRVPRHPHLYVNSATAKRLGLTIPQVVLARAKQVVRTTLPAAAAAAATTTK